MQRLENSVDRQRRRMRSDWPGRCDPFLSSSQHLYAIDMGFSFSSSIATSVSRAQASEEVPCRPMGTTVSLRPETAEAPATRRDAPREKTGTAGRGALRAREGGAVSTPAVGALGIVCAAAAGLDCRSLLVRYRRPGDVDGQRLCRSRPGRHFDRLFPASCRRSLVTENQHVETGQVLYRLDDLPFPSRAAAHRGADRDRAERSERPQGELRWTYRNRSSRHSTTSTIGAPYSSVGSPS